MRVLLGACMPNTSNPALVANVTNNTTPDAGELQLRGAYVSSTSGGDTTDTYYRGMAMWLSGPDTSDAPVEFVADVTTDSSDNTASLHVAFFGSVDDLLAGSPSGTSQSCSVGSTSQGSTSGSADGSTPTSDSPIGAMSVPPAEPTDTSTTEPATNDDSVSAGCAPPSS
jgi:hypothetical protein